MEKKILAERLAANHAAFSDYMGSRSEADFMFAAPAKWTAGQQLDHIVRATSPIVLALRLPKWLVKLLIGTPNRPSRSYEELVQKYNDKLAAGAKASGQFIPKPVIFAQRAALLAKLNTTVANIVRGMDNYSEAELDAYLLPHPILGKLTVREMLYFTEYHVLHHHRLLPISL